jgi:transcriptional regulator with XRE-family HTH domain
MIKMTTPYDQEDDFEKQVEAWQEEEAQRKFIDQLVSNQLKTPNDFTTQMGDLVRQAREALGMSQSELAKKMNRRPSTISDIENGKSEIGIITLVGFAFFTHKPISYFFSNSLLKSLIADVKSKFEYDVVEIAREIEEHQGDKVLTLDLLNFLKDRFVGEYHDSMERDPDEL